MNEYLKETYETYDEIADKYSKDIEHLILKEWFSKVTDKIPGKDILDVGCGSGRDAKYLTAKGFNVYGIDNCDNFLKIAIQNSPESNFYNMDLMDLKFESNKFGAIISVASFLHVPIECSKKTLDGFKRVLKPQGRLFITTKNGDGEKFMPARKYNSTKRRLEIYYTTDYLKKCLEELDFNIIETKIEYKRDEWSCVLASLD